MNLTEYAGYDGLGLAELVRKRAISPRELAALAARAIEAVNGELGAVVETYPDRITGLEEASLGNGPFAGVPFLIKDVFGHEKGRKIEFGSRLCEGMICQTDSNLIDLLRKAGVNVLGRSAAPEYSMAGTTEGALYGNCSTPWGKGYCAGGSSGGAAAAVAAGIVPLAHGSDIGGSIRIPAAMCGGVGFKPSRMRISVGPTVDEGGWGYSMNFVQAKTLRDCAAMLDCLAIPASGDPFIIPKPDQPYRELLKRAPKGLRIGIVMEGFGAMAPDPEVQAAVEATGKLLASLGHSVEMASASTGGIDIIEALKVLFFFGFDSRLDGYGRNTGRKPGPDNLEPVIWSVYQAAGKLGAADFMAAWGAANTARRALGAFFGRYDLWLSPTTARPAEKHGLYNLARAGVSYDTLGSEVFAPLVQHTIPHNLMGTPAISLPLAMHSSGFPIGVQIAAAPAADHLVLQIAAVLEEAMPWARRVPPIHVSKALV